MGWSPYPRDFFIFSSGREKPLPTLVCVPLRKLWGLLQGAPPPVSRRNPHQVSWKWPTSVLSCLVGHPGHFFPPLSKRTPQRKENLSPPPKPLKGPTLFLPEITRDIGSKASSGAPFEGTPAGFRSFLQTPLLEIHSPRTYNVWQRRGKSSTQPFGRCPCVLDERIGSSEAVEGELGASGKVSVWVRRRAKKNIATKKAKNQKPQAQDSQEDDEGGQLREEKLRAQ